MSDEGGLREVARAIIGSNSYMTLGTAAANGVPWVSPVWYAPFEYREFFWVSSPQARHSRNLAAQPHVGIVIFDSHAPVGTGQGVYMAAVAAEVDRDDLDRGIEIFSRRSRAQGAPAWTREDVQPPARHRLYRATASEHFVLTPQDERRAISMD